MKANDLENYIFSDESFDNKALAVFKYQAANCAIYKAFLTGLKVDVNTVSSIKDIPFLPISFFRTHKILADHLEVRKTFLSSGSTSSIRSKHHIHKLQLYESAVEQGWIEFYGDQTDYCFIAMLPGYGDKQTSSLSYMADFLIKRSTDNNSGFYLENGQQVLELLTHNEANYKSTVLLGVTYALLDFAKNHPIQLANTTILETGGMKGNRKELPKKEVHQLLAKSFGLTNIGSEYGMTEMQSQAYSTSGGLFTPSSTLQIRTTEIQDALSFTDLGEIGVINVIDLANLYSCSFIATEDLGILYEDGNFELRGRAANADIRGCNLMLSDALL